MQDAFGVERAEVSKADAKVQRTNAAIIGGTPYVGSIAAPIYGATQAKKGRKGAVAGRTFGRQVVESNIGATPGLALSIAGAKSGSKGMVTAGRYGMLAGGLAGGSHAAYAAMRNAQRRGDIQGVKGSKRD